MKFYGGNSNDVAEEIEATDDGGFIVVGSTSSNSWGNTDAYLLKLDSLCNFEWSTALGGSNNDWGYSVKQTFDRGYIVAITTNSFGHGGYDACLMKRDSLGNYQWKRTYGGPDWDMVYSVVQTFDSGYVFCGETYNNSNGFSDVYIVKTNSFGDTLWTKTIGGTFEDKGNSIIQTSDSSIVVGGIKNTTTDSTQIYLLKLNSSGTLLWDSIYGDTLYENANSIIEASNGDYVMVGSSTSLGVDKDNFILRTDKDGVEIWGNYFTSTGDEELFDLIEDPSGSLIVAGFTEASGGGMKDCHVFYVSSTGFWQNRASTYGGSLNEVGKGIAVANRSKFSLGVAGYSDGFGNGLDDAMVICLDTVYQGQIFTTDTINDFIPLNVKDNADEELIRVYPNPASSYFHIDLASYSGHKLEVKLFNVFGQLILQDYLENENSIIQTNQFPAGIYSITILSGSKKIHSSKIILQ
jgi:hypothetical protein